MALGMSVSFTGCVTPEESSVSLTRGACVTILSETLESVKSFKASVDMECTVSDVLTSSIDGDFLVSISDSGVDMHCSLAVVVDYAIETEEDVNSSMEFYMIDDYVYAYNAADNTYMKSPATISELLASYLTGAGVSLEEVAAYAQELKSAFSEMDVTMDDVLAEMQDRASLSDNVLYWEADYKDAVNEAIDYVATYDIQKTLEAVVNEALAKVDPALTSSEILDSIGMMGDLKIETLLESADEEWLETAQEAYDAVLSEEAIVSLLLEEGFTQADIAKMKAVKIADVLEAYSEYTVNEVLAMLFAENSEETTETTPTFSLKVYTDMAKLYLKTTKLAEVDENVAMIQSMLAALDVTALGSKLSVTYDSPAAISQIACVSNFGLTVTYGTAGTITCSLNASLFELSTSAVTIALPEGATEQVFI